MAIIKQQEKDDNKIWDDKIGDTNIEQIRGNTCNCESEGWVSKTIKLP